jgi:hemerythrin superfamily protein
LTVEDANRKTRPERFLEQDHASLGRLFAELQAVSYKHDTHRSFELLDLIWARLAIHIRAEHLCLFPAIQNAPAQRFTGRDDAPQFTDAIETIKRLRADHDFFMHELAAAVNTLRRLMDSSAAVEPELNEVRVKVAGVLARLEEHNRIEEEQAYRWVALLLNEDEQSELLARIEREFEKQPPRFSGRGMLYEDSADLTRDD